MAKQRSACGRPFSEKDEYQLHCKQIYLRPDTGFRCMLMEARRQARAGFIMIKCPA